MIRHELERYGAYKNSEIDWIRELPEHWEANSIKRYIKVLTDYTANGSFAGLAENVTYLDQGYARLIRLTDLRLNLKNEGLYVDEKAYQYLSKSKIRGGEILVANVGAYTGLVRIVPKIDYKATLGPNMFLVEFKNILNKAYIAYLLSSLFGYEQFRMQMTATAQPKLNKDNFRSVNILVPTIDEQQTISDYLDIKTTQIDQKIDLLTQKAAKYVELKKTLINETVIRGLDNTVNMKDSGVEWIGDVPEHWKVIRMKELGFLYSGLTGKKGDDFTDEHEHSNAYIPFVNIANNQFISLNDMKKVIVYPDENQNEVRKNDLFFLMSSENYEDIGKTAILKVDIFRTYLNSFCRGFRFTNKSIVATYANYLLSAKKWRDSLSVEGKGFTRINLKIEKINDLFVVLPTVDEQESIVKYLNAKTSQIDLVCLNINTKIDKLKELRKTLINDVVTGKLKVTSIGDEEAI